MSPAKRVFVIVGHTAALTPRFTLNDLPGSGGRLDILCRCVTAALCLSHSIRRDVQVYLVLQDQITVRFEGEAVKRLNPDERSTAALVQRALERLPAISASEEQESTPGVFVSRAGLAAVLERLKTQSVELFVLHEHGRDIRTVKIHEPVAFVLSDHQDLSASEEALLERCQRLSLGPVALHADHCIPLVHNELDRRGSEG
jgi:tRNA (pseudouridine54-N1)-methyltransferase